MRPFDVLRAAEQLFKFAAGGHEGHQIDRHLIAADRLQRYAPELAHDRRHGTGHELVGGAGDAFDQRMAWATQIAGKQHARIIGFDHALDDNVGPAAIGAVGGDAPIAERQQHVEHRRLQSRTVDVDDRFEHPGKAVGTAVFGTAGASHYQLARADLTPQAVEFPRPPGR